MRFHLGPIPDSPDFVPDASWKLVRTAPAPMLENLIALPIGVAAAALVAKLWFLLTPITHIIPSAPWPAFVLVIAAFVVVHESLHALVYPKAGMSANTIFGFWAALGFYAHYDGELSPNRLLACLLMPLLVISIVPLGVSAVTHLAWDWLAFLSVLNAVAACVDLLLAGAILFQVPATAIVRFKIWRIYWRVRDALIA